MEVNFSKNGEKRGLHPGVLRPFLPPLLGWEYLPSQWSPNTWLMPMWGPIFLLPQALPALSQNLVKPVIPTHRSGLSGQDKAAVADPPGVPSRLPGRSQ